MFGLENAITRYLIVDRAFHSFLMGLGKKIICAHWSNFSDSRISTTVQMVCDYLYLPDKNFVSSAKKTRIFDVIKNMWPKK